MPCRNQQIQAWEATGAPESTNRTWILDWVGLFEGADADERRSLIDSRDWEERIRPDLLEIRNRLQEAGEHQLLIRTVARQAVTFLVGFHLRRTAQFDVTFTQRMGRCGPRSTGCAPPWPSNRQGRKVSGWSRATACTPRPNDIRPPTRAASWGGGSSQVLRYRGQHN